MEHIIRVCMAGLDVAKSPDNLETLALGSCVGVVLYESNSTIGGMAHAMLPDISFARIDSRSNITKFVNTSILELLNKMEKIGAKKKYIIAKLAGGANMFPDLPKENSIHIGKRNIDMAKKMLESLNIPIIAEDTGGHYGRSILLDTSSGQLRIKTAMLGVKFI